NVAPYAGMSVVAGDINTNAAIAQGLQVTLAGNVGMLGKGAQGGTATTNAFNAANVSLGTIEILTANSSKVLYTFSNTGNLVMGNIPHSNSSFANNITVSSSAGSVTTGFIDVSGAGGAGSTVAATAGVAGEAAGTITISALTNVTTGALRAYGG